MADAKESILPAVCWCASRYAAQNSCGACDDRGQANGCQGPRTDRWIDRRSLLGPRDVYGPKVAAARVIRRTSSPPNAWGDLPASYGFRWLCCGWRCPSFAVLGRLGRSCLSRSFHPPRLSWPAALVALAAYLATLVCWKKMGKSWRMGIDPNETTQLIITGPYRHVRHPIYAVDGADARHHRGLPDAVDVDRRADSHGFALLRSPARGTLFSARPWRDVRRILPAGLKVHTLQGNR